MKIHEYQGKAILARFGMPVPRGDVAFNADEAVAIGERLSALLMAACLESEGVRSVAASGEAATIRVHQSLVELPDANYKPRAWDPRSGYGDETFLDYTAPLGMGDGHDTVTVRETATGLTAMVAVVRGRPSDRS